MPFNVFKSLQSLVLHYSQSSLEEHNDLLTTTLKYPIFSPYIKKLHQQQQQQQQPPPQPPPLTPQQQQQASN